MDNNRTLMLRIYMILKRHSNESHPLDQVSIKKYLEETLSSGIFNHQQKAPPNRKTISSHIKDLKEMADLEWLDGDILTHEAGNHYFSPKITEGEIRFLFDAIASSKFISREQREDLINKLNETWKGNASPNFKRILENKRERNLYNAEFFYAIESLTEAIEAGCKVSFQYMTYDIHKNLVPLYHQNNGFIVVSPYQLTSAVNHYFLFCNIDSTQQRRFLRVDKIKNISLLKTEKIHPLPENFDVYGYMRRQAFMFGGEETTIQFRGQMRMLGQVIDFFGEDVDLRKLDQDHFEATVRTSIDSIKYWILQYISAIDHIRPRQLHDIIIGYLEDALERNKALLSSGNSN